MAIHYSKKTTLFLIFRIINYKNQLIEIKSQFKKSSIYFKEGHFPTPAVRYISQNPGPKIKKPAMNTGFSAINFSSRYK